MSRRAPQHEERRLRSYLNLRRRGMEHSLALRLARDEDTGAMERLAAESEHLYVVEQS